MTLKVIVDGNETPLDDGNPFLLMAHDGWGMPRVNRLIERGPLQDGVSDLGFHLGARSAMLVIGIKQTTLSALYDARDQLLFLFKPENSPTLAWDLPNGDQRRIDVHFVGALGIPWNPDRWAAMKVGIDLYAPDPSFYHPSLLTTQFSTADSGELVFPIEFPIEFGFSSINEGVGIGYGGTWYSYPTIVLTGPLDNPIITNVTTGKKIELDYNIPAGDKVTITLTPGEISIVDDSDTNLIGTLTTDSDIADFRLIPSLEFGATETNNILIEASSATAASLIEINYRERFIGL